VGRILSEIFPIEADRALAWPQQTAGGLEQGAFTRPIGSNQSDNLSFINGEGDTLEGMDLSIIGMHIFDFEKGHHKTYKIISIAFKISNSELFLVIKSLGH
jgi:hypothetical protein